LADVDRNDEVAPQPKPARRPLRRTILVWVAVVGALVVYAYGFKATKVSLDEISSQTRQDNLIRVLRELARPELVTYERVPTNTDVAFYMPCPSGGFTPEAAPSSSRHIVVDPACVEPGGTVTITGTHFAPNARGTLALVPPTSDLELRLATFQADTDGSFRLTVDTRERPEDDAQTIRAVTSENVGSLFDRARVWQDDNENGIQDPVEVPESGLFAVDVSVGIPDVPGIALVSPEREIAQFITYGESFTATNGVATGDTAVPPDEDVTTGLHVASLDGDTVTLQGDAGTDLSGWSIAFYDATSGIAGNSIPVTDSIVMSPRISEAATVTIDGIIETVFLALLATTAGVFLAVPLSFLAARNLMRDVSTTVLRLALQILALPVGIAVGVVAAHWAASLSGFLTDNIVLVILGLIAIPALIYVVLKWALPTIEETPPTPAERAARIAALAGAAVAAIVVLFLLAELLGSTGDWLAARLGAFDFLGEFFSKIGDILAAIITLLTALATAGLLMNLAGRAGTAIRRHLQLARVMALGIPLAAASGGVIAVIIAKGIGSLYAIDDPAKTIWIPFAAGALVGLALAVRSYRSGGTIGIGLTIYYIARTVFNAIRSIEPLIMAIVFVVWVGLGPFAGSLALALHTVAALAKLYSEQVESIMAGPMEAVKATGATRLQTVVYSVIPQIVPPYISFTLYRWDINVRMSTIIGFVGGGGIGLILQQNIRLLNYRAASVNMLAIAVVVASMDYLSSRVRERLV
jgi:phosphonate ABC transporter permease subunit PhnE